MTVVVFPPKKNAIMCKNGDELREQVYTGMITKHWYDKQLDVKYSMIFGTLNLKVVRFVAPGLTCFVVQLILPFLFHPPQQSRC